MKIYFTKLVLQSTNLKEGQCVNCTTGPGNVLAVMGAVLLLQLRRNSPYMTLLFLPLQLYISSKLKLIIASSAAWTHELPCPSEWLSGVL